jgi:hypothetical protein
VIWQALGSINGAVVLAVVVLGVALVLRPQRHNPTTEGEPMPATVRLLRPLPCQVDGCAGTRAHRHLVCPACWRRVPKDLRSNFYRTWDQFQSGSPKGYVRWLAARQKTLESLQ